MTIGALIAAQLVFDLLLVVLLVTVARQRREAAAPPAWHDEFLQLAKEVMAVADSLLEAPDRREDAPVGDRATTAAPTPVRRGDPPARRGGSARDEAFSLIRAGMAADDVGRRTGLLPGELRLITSLVAAEQRQGAPSPRTRQSLPPSDGDHRDRTMEAGDFSPLGSPVSSGTALA